MRALDIDIEERTGIESEPEAGRFGHPPVRVSLLGEPAEVGNVLLAARTLRAFDRGAAHYPIHRLIRAAARRPVEELFDELAQGMGLAAQRLGEASLLLDGPGVLVSARGRRKTDYSSITIAVWADSTTRLTSVRERLFAVIGDRRLQERTFTIDWHFKSGHLGLTSATFEEIADPPLLDAAYPALREPVEDFIARYLAARETVLILQGPPGTGKTRFVRAVLAAMSQCKGDSAKALYTADTRALESDEIFVEFVTGSHDAFVIEDADHLLKARADGNLDLHRFLAIADGVVRAQGRKILFTTNLPNVGDIDEALLRPGRCFANVRLGPLEKAEIERLLMHLQGADHARERALALTLPDGRRSATLAAVYRAIDLADAH
ncbi:MAG: AAA family ATPase [Proteobacteria bacterium]|nr:AAA family ATPase [Pseudomonadota bacterium]